MNVEPKPGVQILEDAWKRYGQLNALSKKYSRQHYFWRGLIFFLCVFAVILAVVPRFYVNPFPTVMNTALKVLLIASLVAVSILAAFLNKIDNGSKWRIFRAGAEEIQKEIYLYRTLFRDAPDRQERLENRLKDVQYQVNRVTGEILALNQPLAMLQQYYDPGDPGSDEGHNDLTGEEYARYRLENQLAAHIRKLQQYESERSRQQLTILTVGGVGVLLAVIGGSYSVWVAITSTLVAVLIGWQGLRNLDPIVKNHSRVVSELMNIYNRWNSLDPDERTRHDFFRMVKSTEDILSSQNVKYIRPVLDTPEGETLNEAEMKGNSLLRMTVDADVPLKYQSQRSEVDIASDDGEDVRQQSAEHIDEAPVSIAEEALSELVQAELTAMADATGQAGHSAFLVDHMGTGRLADTLNEIAKEFDDQEIGIDTPASVLNELLSRYPATNDIKG